MAASFCGYVLIMNDVEDLVDGMADFGVDVEVLKVGARFKCLCECIGSASERKCQNVASSRKKMGISSHLMGHTIHKNREVLSFFSYKLGGNWGAISLRSRHAEDC